MPLKETLGMVVFSDLTHPQSTEILKTGLYFLERMLRRCNRLGQYMEPRPYQAY